MDRKVLNLYKLQVEDSVISGKISQPNDILDITRELLSDVCLIPLDRLLELEYKYINLPYEEYLNKDITEDSNKRWNKLIDRINKGIEYIEREINLHKKQMRLEAELALVKLENEMLLKELQQ